MVPAIEVPSSVQVKETREPKVTKVSILTVSWALLIRIANRVAAKLAPSAGKRHNKLNISSPLKGFTGHVYRKGTQLANKMEWRCEFTSSLS